MRKPLTNIGASIRQRLFNLSKETGQSLDFLLTRYTLERLLFRLSQSRHRERFVLKGAMLIATWFHDPHRPTRDVDLLGFGDPDPEATLAAFREICAISANDGLDLTPTISRWIAFATSRPMVGCASRRSPGSAAPR